MNTVNPARHFPIFAFDHHWFAIINGWTTFNGFFNDLAIICSKFAPEIWAVIFLLLWFWPPLRQNRARRAVVYAVAAGVLALVVNVILGHLLPFRPRPFVLEPGMVHQLLAHANDTSFPSDHAAGSFAFAIGLFYARPRDGWWALLFAALVAVARVMTGLHWPTDVMAGAAVGVLAGFFVLVLRNQLEWLVRMLFRIFRFEAPRRVGMRSR